MVYRITEICTTPYTRRPSSWQIILYLFRSYQYQSVHSVLFFKRGLMKAVAWQNSTFQEHVMAGLMWALEGASTKAYGAGLVGNSTESQGASAMSSSTSAPGETSTTTSASASGTTGSAQPSASSGGATQKPLSGGKTMGAAVIGGVMAGVALAL